MNIHPKRVPSFACHVLFGVALCILLAAPTTIAAAAAAEGKPAKAPDLSSPKAAYTAYNKASRTGDSAAIHAVVLSNDEADKLIQSHISGSAAQQKMNAAISKQWGEAGLGVFDKPNTPETPEGYVYKVTGNTAGLIAKDDPKHIITHFKKVDGKWKVDLTAETTETLQRDIKFSKATEKGTRGFTESISQGKYKTANEAFKAYIEMVTKIALGDDDK